MWNVTDTVVFKSAAHETNQKLLRKISSFLFQLCKKYKSREKNKFSENVNIVLTSELIPGRYMWIPLKDSSSPLLEMNVCDSFTIG